MKKIKEKYYIPKPEYMDLWYDGLPVDPEEPITELDLSISATCWGMSEEDLKKQLVEYEREIIL